MARGEGDKGLKSNFVERVGKLPMFNVVWDYASNTYSHIKESNKLVNFTLTNAEKTATFVAGQAKPVVLKFEKQIQAVDDLACKGLGTLEEKVPFITKQADEIIDDTRKLYDTTVNSRLENIKKYGNDTVRSAADFGLKRATAIFGERLVQSVVTSVDGILVVTQNYIDHILPPTKEEKQKNGSNPEKEKESSLARLTRISSTIRRRAYRTLLLKVEYAQERTFDLLLTYPIQMIEFSKTHLETAVEYANQLWVAINQQEENGPDTSDKSRVEKQLLYLARLVSRQVAATYSSLSLTSTETESANSSQELSNAPVALTVARNGALWVLGMLRLVPQLLPIYMYGLVSWLSDKDKPTTTGNKKKEDKANGVLNSSADLSHNHSNSVHSSRSEDTNGHRSDASIPEENEE